MQNAFGLMGITKHKKFVKTSNQYSEIRKALSDSKRGKPRLDMVGKQYFGASEETKQSIWKKLSESRKGKSTNYPKIRKPLSNRTEAVFEKISKSRLKTLDKYKTMTDNEFSVWLSRQSLFNKNNSPNSNVTRALLARKIPLSRYYSYTDFSKSWHSKKNNKNLFYGL